MVSTIKSMYGIRTPLAPMRVSKKHEPPHERRICTEGVQLRVQNVQSVSHGRVGPWGPQVYPHSILSRHATGHAGVTCSPERVHNICTRIELRRQILLIRDHAGPALTHMRPFLGHPTTRQNRNSWDARVSDKVLVQHMQPGLATCAQSHSVRSQ